MKIDQYDPKTIEAKWAKIWEEKKIYQVDVKSAKRPFGPSTPSTSFRTSPLRAQGKPFYNLAMFPYPSGEGLHVGHIVPYSGVDTFGRYKKMKGFDVFEPMGFDSFGIHSENFAIKIGKHPKQLIAETTTYFRDKQMKRLGTLFDWSRQVITSDPSYYKWTQWIFVQMFKHGLAEKKMSLVTYCPSCKTVLSDEQTETKDGVVICERCKTPIERKEMKQWFFKITKYAERLLNNLSKIDWSERTKMAQKNWIGKSEGIDITYKVKGISDSITCFTTTPVNFGATFLVLAPEHPFISKLLSGHSEPASWRVRNPSTLLGTGLAKRKNKDDVDARFFTSFRMTEEKIQEIKEYVEKASKKTEQERIAEGKDKTGVFTGLYAINHVTGKEIPIWVSDFVLVTVGTGAIQGCPGHDKRDFFFAKKFGIPIPRVVTGPHGESGPIEKEEDVVEKGSKGKMINSDFLNGLEFADAMQKTMDYFEEKGWGKRVTHFKLRDWCISRQRYWGPPIPMVYCSDCMRNGITYYNLDQKSKIPPSPPAGGFGGAGKVKIKIYRDDFADMAGWFPVAEEELPVLLPETKDYLPDGSGKSPLARIPEFAKTKCPYCGGEADRETDVSDTFLDSSWYFLRYPSVSLDDPKAGPAGGFPPASAREKALRAVGSLSTPVTRFLPWDQEVTKKWLPVDMYIGGQEHACLHLMYARFVTMALYDMGYINFSAKGGLVDEPFTKFFAHGLMVKEGFKMSKSRGNVVDPVKYLDLYGSDCLRMYVLFMGPYDQKMDFRDSGIDGMYRFLGRVYSFIQQIKDVKGKTEDKTLLQLLHKMTKIIGEDIEKLHFNTSIAHLMEILNAFSDKREGVSISMTKHYLTLLAPFAPFIAEELWMQVTQSEVGKDNWSVHQQSWPEYDEKLLKEEEVTMVVQVNGKVRDQFIMNPSTTLGAGNVECTIKERVEEEAEKREKVKRYISGKKIVKTVFVPGKLVNFVVELE